MLDYNSIYWTYKNNFDESNFQQMYQWLGLRTVHIEPSAAKRLVE